MQCYLKHIICIAFQCETEKENIESNANIEETHWRFFCFALFVLYCNNLLLEMKIVFVSVSDILLCIYRAEVFYQ